VRTEVVSKDVGVRENGAKAWVVLECSMHVQKLDYEEGVYELGDHVGEKALNSNLLPRLGLAKISLHTSFPNCLLKNI
jgi:hypothetical protein